MYAFYHLVNIDNTVLDKDDYNFILLAYDDEFGEGIEAEYIDDHRLTEFLNGKPIHFEKMFLTDKNPKCVVYWGHSKERGWTEKQQIDL